MISAFKHIRLSGYNLTPVQGVAYDGSSTLRLGFGNSGLAYYSELTGISGYLQGLINTATADVNSINNLQGNIYLTGQDGITIQVDSNLGEIKIVGNSGYFQNIVDTISNNLFTTGSTLSSSIQNVSNDLFATGSTLSQYNTAYSGWANAEFVKKATQQVFETSLAPTNLDAYAVIYPVPFASTPKIQATLEVPGDVMYNLSIKSIGTAGYTGILSDNVLEAGAKIHTFASTQ